MCCFQAELSPVAVFEMRISLATDLIAQIKINLAKISMPENKMLVERSSGKGMSLVAEQGRVQDFSKEGDGCTTT